MSESSYGLDVLVLYGNQIIPITIMAPVITSFLYIISTVIITSPLPCYY